MVISTLSPDNHPGFAVTGSPVLFYSHKDFFGIQAKRLQPGSAWEAFSRWRSFSVSSSWFTTFSRVSYEIVAFIIQNSA
jgi:hypothetical protein